MLEVIGVVATVAGVFIAYLTLRQQKRGQREQGAGEKFVSPTGGYVDKRLVTAETELQVAADTRTWSIEHPHIDFLQPSGRLFQPPKYDPALSSHDQDRELARKYWQDCEDCKMAGVYDKVELPLPKNLVWYALHQTVYFSKVFPSWAGSDVLRPLPPQFGPGQSFLRSGITSERDKKTKFNIIDSNAVDSLTYFIDNTRGLTYPDERDWYLTIKCLPISEKRCQLSIEIFWFDPKDALQKLMASQSDLQHVSQSMPEKFSGVIDSIIGNLCYVALNLDKFGFVPGVHDWLYEPNDDPKLSNAPLIFTSDLALQGYGEAETGIAIPRGESIGSLEYVAGGEPSPSNNRRIGVTMGSRFPNYPEHFLKYSFLKNDDVLPAHTGLGFGRSVIALSSSHPDGMKTLDPNFDHLFQPHSVTGLKPDDYNMIKPFVMKGEVLGQSKEGDPIVAPVTGFAKFDMAMHPGQSILIRQTA